MPIVGVFTCDTCGSKKSFKGDLRKAFALLESQGWSLKATVTCASCVGEVPSSTEASPDSSSSSLSQALFSAVKHTPVKSLAPGERLEACSDGSAVGGNPGHGGWGWAASDGTYASASAVEHPSTNQRMEIQGAVEALEACANPLILWTDSRYVADCFNKKWYRGWQRNGWRTSSKEPVKNQDLWRRFVAALEGHPDLEVRWVKGHQDHALNVRADTLAHGAAQEGRALRSSGMKQPQR